MNITKPIDMKAVRRERTPEEHYQDIADMLDTYADEDRKFMLWYLLGDLISELEKRLDANKGNPIKNETDYAVKRMMYDHYKWANDIREVLLLEIF